MKSQILKIIKDNIWIDVDNNQQISSIKGNIRNKKIKPLVGDYVEYELIDNHYIITDIINRTNSLIRPKVANVDIVCIVQSSISPDFDCFLLDQMICFYEQHNIEVVVALTKTDINYSDNLKNLVNDYKKMNYKIFDVNKETEFNEMLQYFSNKLICLAGNSGVGKSTLVNKICPELNLRTQEISTALNRGKHTTTNTSIVKLQNFKIVDTPGYATVRLELTKSEFAHVFFKKILDAKYCKFFDCLHLDNSCQCLIKNLLNDSILVKWRYNNYLKILNTLEVNRYDKDKGSKH